MLKKYGDRRFIGASLGSAAGGVPQNDRAFASVSIATQSAEYTTCKPLPQVAPRSANGLLAAPLADNNARIVPGHGPLGKA